jgi:hypothetical protein
MPERRRRRSKEASLPRRTGWAMDQAFMLILHDPPTGPLTDEQVAHMKMPRSRIEAIVKRRDADQE